MTEVNREFLLAFAGIVFLIVWAFGMALTFYSDKEEKTQEEDPTGDKDDPSVDPQDERAAPYSIIRETQPDKRKQQKGNSAFQRVQINIGRGQNVITGITAIAGALALLILYGTLEVTRTQIQISERPWISIESVAYVPSPSASPTPVAVNGLHVIEPITLSVTLKNYGKSVANDAKLVYDPIFIPSDFSGPDIFLVRAAKDICHLTGGIEVTVFPNGPPKSVQIAIPTTQEVFTLVGCVKYGDPVQACDKFEHCHWSRFAYIFYAKETPHLVELPEYNDVQ